MRSLIQYLVFLLKRARFFAGTIRRSLGVGGHRRQKANLHNKGQIQTDWLAEFEKKEQSRKYEEFLEKTKLRNFADASNVALALNPESLSSKQLLAVIKTLYSSTHGVYADQLLEPLCREILIEGQLDAKLIVGLMERVSISGFHYQRKLELLSIAKGLIEIESNEGLAYYYALQWMEYGLRESENGTVDPLDYIDWDHVDRFGPGLVMRFVPSLKAFGHVDSVKRLLSDVYESEGFKKLSTFRLFSVCWPEWFQGRDRLDLDFPEVFENVSFLPMIYAGQHLHDEARDLFDRALGHHLGNFSALGLLQKDILLRFLLKQENYHQVVSLSEEVFLPSSVLPVLVAKGYISLEAGDYLTARDCFQQVLLQDPSDSLAATGIRFALPRAGRAMDELLHLRDQIGYGTRGAGRSGVRDFSGELTISLLMSGDYIKGQFSKRNSKHWLAMKEHFGPRFLNFERLGNHPESTIFIIGDEGVGDEIRTAQFYSEVSHRFKQVVITCDPRLVNILRKSFPDISFLPVPRLRKLLGPGSGDEPRLSGFGEKVSNYLTESCRPYLEDADFITFGQNLFFNYVIGEIKRPDEGAYLDWECGRQFGSGDDKIKVGILWRSHLRHGARKMMYLDVEDFLPLTKIEGVEVWSIQHAIDEDEYEFCKENNIKLIEDVDLFNDFEGLSGYLSAMDLLVGVSSVPMELGAAFGTQVWMLGFSPENYFLRTGGGADSYDRYTLNSTVIAPPWIDFTDSRDACVQQVFDDVCYRLIEQAEKLEVGQREAG